MIGFAGNFRTVMTGPTSDSGSITALTRDPSGSRASTRGLERLKLTLEGTLQRMGTAIAESGQRDQRELAAFHLVFGKTVPLSEAPPRPGDAVGAFANVDRSAQLLDWHTQLTLDDAIASALAWGEKRQEILGYE